MSRLILARAAMACLFAAMPRLARTGHDVTVQQEIVTCRISELPGLSAQYARARRVSGLETSEQTAMEPERLDARGAADFWRVTSSVTGTTPAVSGRMGGGGVGLPSLGALPCDRAVRARDRIAWSMVSIGYSAREIADVIDGHLTRADLDQAYARTMAGESRASVAAFLESRWREPASSVARRSPSSLNAQPLQEASIAAPGALPADLAIELAERARDYRVEPALVRAVIAAESGANPRALSPAGAIGLMQLMPATAAALGVNPWNPIENLRGGIAYLASLLRAYAEDERLALIAYNAGPQHADRVRAGHAVAYRETRQYLEAIAARYPLR
jgi:transglycosylase-like protein with SLT domain